MSKCTRTNCKGELILLSSSYGQYWKCAICGHTINKKCACGGAECTYTSNGNEVDDECGEEIIECTLYGNECFETECGEACGNCGEDCSEDCGDSWCGEDDTGCSEDDCCVYSGGSQSEGDDECGEDCGDCCVYS